ncbi:hypothetical protein [Bacillus thuringiensis]|nr:hypothetical protein [Bacillus thuringiensis]MBD8075412.1 hypothetical protein [Bacillus thuringiensis]
MAETEIAYVPLIRIVTLKSEGSKSIKRLEFPGLFFTLEDFLISKSYCD